MSKRIGGSNAVGFFFYVFWMLATVAVAAGTIRKAPIAALFLLPTILCELVLAVAFLVRRPAVSQIHGIVPRLAAYVGTFILPTFFWAAGTWKKEWIVTSQPAMVGLGMFLWFLGTVLTLWTAWRLRSAFSLVPQARKLVTSGPYRIARHPMYASHLFQYAGLWIAHMTLPVTMVVTVWFAVMLTRVRYEERVLASAFTDYAEYRQRVGLLFPRLRLAAPQPKKAPAGVSAEDALLGAAATKAAANDAA